MKKILVLSLYLVTIFVCNAQIQTSESTSNYKKSSRGVMVLWYGYDGKANQYSAKTVSFDDSFTEAEVATKLKKGVYLSGDYIGFEFLENYSCRDTYEHLARTLKLSLSDVQDLRNGTCWDTNTIIEKEPEALDKINPQAKARMKPILQDHENKLIAQGWKKVYEVYKNDASYGKLVMLPENSYTAIGAIYADGNKNLQAQIVLINYDKTDEFLAGIGQNIIGEYLVVQINDIQAVPGVRQGFFGINTDGKVVPSSGLIVFERLTNFKRDFLSLIEGRDNGFADFKGNFAGTNTTNNPIHFSTVILGLKDAKIDSDGKTDKFYVSLDFDDPKTLKFLDNLQEAIKDFPAMGYTSKSSKNEFGGDDTHYLKNGEEIFKLESNPAKGTALFIIYKTLKK